MSSYKYLVIDRDGLTPLPYFLEHSQLTAFSTIEEAYEYIENQFDDCIGESDGEGSFYKLMSMDDIRTIFRTRRCVYAIGTEDTEIIVFIVKIRTT